MFSFCNGQILAKFATGVGHGNHRARGQTEHRQFGDTKQRFCELEAAHLRLACTLVVAGYLC